MSEPTAVSFRDLPPPSVRSLWPIWELKEHGFFVSFDAQTYAESAPGEFKSWPPAFHDEWFAQMSWRPHGTTWKHIAELAKKAKSAAAQAEAQAIVKRDETIEQIAKRVLHIETLDVRGRDGLDFYDLGVASLRAALVAAYVAGQAAAVKS